MKNIQAGKEVMTHIQQLKEAQNTLMEANVPVEIEYWEIKDSVFQDKLKTYLKLWYFPLGSGTLSKTKQEQLDALKQFNLTKLIISVALVIAQQEYSNRAWITKAKDRRF